MLSNPKIPIILGYVPKMNLLP